MADNPILKENYAYNKKKSRDIQYFADGGEVGEKEPEGIDSFLNEPTPQPNTGASVPAQLPQGDQHGAIVNALSDQQTADSIVPTSSPIDLVAGAVAAPLAEGIIGAAPEILGNEIGSVGARLPKSLTAPPAPETNYSGYVDKALARIQAMKNAGLEPLEQDLRIVGAPTPALNNQISNVGSNVKTLVAPPATEVKYSGYVDKALARIQAMKNAGLQPLEQDLLVVEKAAKNKPRFANGGEVPSGLDEFIGGDANESPQVPQNGTSDEPAGLNDFVHDEEVQEKYGSPSEQLKAGLEGAAKGLAGPLAPMAERALGVNPEAIRGREEANPTTHTLSELGGFGLGLFTGSGEAALVGKAGEAAAQAANISSKIGTKAVQAATEMGLMQAGDEISKAVLEDPNQSLETAVASVGLSGLLGLTGGAALGAGGAALGAISPLWKSTFGDKLAQGLEDFRGRIAEKAAGHNPVEAVTDELTQYHKNITDLADEVYGAKGLKAQDIAKAVPELDNKIMDQTQEVSDNINSQIKKMVIDTDVYPARLTKRLQSDLERYMSKVTNPEVTSHDIFNATQDLKQTLQGYSKYDKFIKPTDDAYDFVKDSKSLAHNLKEALEDKSVWGKAAERQQKINKAFSDYLPSLKDFEKKFTTEQAGEKVIDPGKIATYMNQLGKPSAQIKQSMLKDFLDASEKYRNTIGEIHSNLGIDHPISPSTLSATKSTLQKITPGMKLADTFIDKFGPDAAGTLVGGGVGAIVGQGLGSKELGAIAGGHMLGPTISSILKPLLTNEASATGFKAASQFIKEVAKGTKLLANASKGLFETGSKVLPQNLMPNAEHRDKIDKFVKKSQIQPTDLTKVGGNLGHYLPDHGQAAGQTAANVVNSINSVRPSDDKKSPLDADKPMNSFQKARYNRTLDLAQQPLMVLDHAKSGTLTSKDVMQFKTMYPNLYSKVVTQVTNDMTTAMSKGVKIPYKLRIGLSMLLGHSMDSTTTPGSIQAAQATFNETNAMRQGGTSAPIKHKTQALSKFSQQYQTPTQRAAANSHRD